MVYYNEFNPKMAAWLRELIKAGLIAKGEVDERDIREVQPNDLRGYRQCHFFAGLAGWSLALRLAGWDDDRPVWSASLPCQPWSQAGEGAGVSDSRNLWPAFFRLVQKLKPEHIFGEQVEAAIKLGWLDGISTDLESESYTVGSVVLPAASVGAPHPRHRIFWVADAGHQRARRATKPGEEKSRRALGDTSGRGECCNPPGPCTYCGKPNHWRPDCPDIGEIVRLGIPNGAGPLSRSETTEANRYRSSTESAGGNESGGMGDGERLERHGTAIAIPEELRSLAHSSAWRDWEIIGFTDGKTRRIESGLKPLVDGLPKELVRCRDLSAPLHAAEARQMRLHGYGNAIVSELAATFIQAFLDTQKS